MDVLELSRIRVGVALSGGSDSLNGWSTARELASNRTWPTLSHLNGFCAALGAATGTEAVAYPVGHYSELLDGMVAGDIELAWLPPVVALRATGRGKTLPIALPVRNGTAYYSTALFARAESGLVSPSDLRGVRAAWVDRQSAAGYIVIRASLKMRGVDLAQAFGQNTFYGSHDAVTRAVLEGRAEVGASYVLLDPRRSAPLRAGWGTGPVQMLATAGPIPSDVLAATVRLPVPTIRGIQRAIVNPPTEELRRAAMDLFSSQGFVEADSEHLEPLSAILNHHVEERVERSAVYPTGAGRRYA
jgi:phosphonate transport system substrate-binding protein